VDPKGCFASDNDDDDDDDDVYLLRILSTQLLHVLADGRNFIEWSYHL
jgi:hypothetical protein